MRRTLILELMILTAVLVAGAEQKKGIVVEGGEPDERASARLLYWDQQVNASAGQVAIDYGRPEWKKQYQDPAILGKLTKGQVWRMGNNYWTALDTQLVVVIGGRRITPGLYYLGLYRSPDGATWALAYINPTLVRSRHLDAFDIAKAPILFKTEMTIGKAAAITPKLTITFSHPPDDIRDATLKIAWGNMVLTTPVKVLLAP
ncbi:MAG: hypothetical protein DMG21_15955 [Acidobacteria bacterium]|nr:MAG: hypothetical protein DMG21_15955 [Acidobacteriota bacterium]